jgi:hypothetical protein
VSDLADNEALFLQFSADNAKMLRAFEVAANKVGQYASQIETRTLKMAQKVEAAGQLAGDGFAKGLNRSQFMELGHSARATFDALAAGASPLRVLAMEGPRVVQALGQGGLGTTLGELAGKINPVILTLGGLGAALAAGAISAVQYVGHVHEIEAALYGLGRASGATIADVDAIAAAQAKNGTITAGAAEKIEAAMLSAGRVTSDNLGEATTVVREFAQATHTKLTDATKDLAKAFEDPAKGAHELGLEYGLLGEEQVKEIKRIQEHEGRAAALKKLLEDLERELKRSGGALADHADGWAAVATAIGNAWENLGKYVALAAGLAPDSVKLGQLKAERQTFAASGDQGLIDQLPGLDAQIAALQAKVDAADKLTRAAAKRAQANQRSIEIADAQKKTAEQTGQFDAAAQSALDTGRADVAKAQAALVEGIMGHAAAEKDAVDKNLQKKLDELEAEAQRIAKSKNDADKLAQRAKINSAKAAEQEAAELQKQAIDRKATTAALEQTLAYNQRVHAEYSRIAENSAAMATTAAERNRIERDLLLKEQREDLDAFDRRAKNELAGLTGEDLEARRSQLDAERAAKVDRNASDQSRQAFDQAGPLDKYLRSVQDLDTTLQNDAVESIRSFDQAILSVGENTKDAGRILENWLLSTVTRAIGHELEADLAGPLVSGAKGVLGFLGLSGGGQVRGPGTTTSDSIPTFLSDEEFVVNAAATRKHLGLLQAINSGKGLHLAGGGLVGSPVGALRGFSSMPARAIGGVTILNQLHFHAEGAVVTQDLLDQAHATARHEAAVAGMAARTGALADMQRSSYLNNLNSGG